MKKKWLILSIALGILSFSYLWIHKTILKESSKKQQQNEREVYFESVSIREFSPTKIPCLEFDINGKACIAKLDLGFRCQVSATKELMQEVSEKSFIRSIATYGFKGKEYKSDLYEVPKVTIGRVTFFHPTLQEESEEFVKDAFLQASDEASPYLQSRIGWELFSNINLFMDFQNSKIAFCNSIDTLREQGYPVDSFVKTPLLLNRGWIEFEAMTERGSLRCLLDTGSTGNILHTEFLNNESIDQIFEDPKNRVEIPIFSIERVDFGAIIFHRLPIKMPFHIDAIIGMEFLATHLVFIDFKNKQIYFAPIKTDQSKSK